MLDGLSILIVEDDDRIALMLSEAIEDLLGRPVGPVPTVKAGLALLAAEEVDAAIIDANLIDRDVTPLAMALLDRVVPFVVHTGKGLPAELASLHPDLPIVMKPAAPTKVLAALLQQVSPDRSLFDRQV